MKGGGAKYRGKFSQQNTLCAPRACVCSSRRRYCSARAYIITGIFSRTPPVKQDANAGCRCFMAAATFCRTASSSAASSRTRVYMPPPAALAHIAHWRSPTTRSTPPPPAPIMTGFLPAYTGTLPGCCATWRTDILSPLLRSATMALPTDVLSPHCFQARCARMLPAPLDSRVCTRLNALPPVQLRCMQRIYGSYLRAPPDWDGCATYRQRFALAPAWTPDSLPWRSRTCC